MRSHQGWWAPRRRGWCPQEGRTLGHGDTQGGDRVNVKTAVRVTGLQAKDPRDFQDHQQPTSSRERGMNQTLPPASEGTRPADTLVSGFQPPGPRGSPLCCLRPGRGVGDSGPRELTWGYSQGSWTMPAEAPGSAPGRGRPL